jgi:hypothetical protein
MKHHDRRPVGWTVIDEVHAQAGLNVQIICFEGIIRKACEAGFVGSQNTHAIDCPD